MEILRMRNFSNTDLNWETRALGDIGEVTGS